MPNEEVLGPRKTMFVLVIVVGCFAVLWPRILSPLILGYSRDQLKPNAFDREAAVKQERPSTRGAGPHPALRERGRAIPPGAATARPVTAMPPHVRVRSSPLSVYYENIKPPPIPGMRPPLGSPGGPVPAPKSSMGFVMPIYTICIIVFFVYTLSKVLFKRTASPYEPVSPDHQFRSRVFRDDSRTSPDKLVVTAISGLVAEVQQQMDASYAQNQQRQEAQDDHARPYTNGTILHNTGPVHIVTTEYREASKEKSPEPQKEVPEPSPEVKEASPEPEKISKESLETKEELTSEAQFDVTPEINQIEESDSKINVDQEKVPEGNDLKLIAKEEDESVSDEAKEESGSEPELIEINYNEDELMKLTNDVDETDDVKVVQDFLNEESKALKDKQSTPDLLEEAIKEDSSDKVEEQENASVKVVGMEMTAHTVDGGAVPRAPPPGTSPPVPPVPPTPPTHRPHEAEEVKSIFLETEIPQKSRVLVTDFAEDRPEDSAPTSNSPMVVSGKMTLSLIQDAPRETPERDPESTVDDFTTASAITQPAAEKQAEEESEEEIEIEEEIEVEEIEEEVEDEEIEEIEEDEEDEPVETKEPLQINEPVVVDENVNVRESVKVKEPVKEETAKDIVEEAAGDSEEIAEYEQEDQEEVKVIEPVKLKDPVKEEKTEKNIDNAKEQKSEAKDDKE